MPLSSPSAKSVTLAQIKLEQDHDEAQVRAQSALVGERAVALTRLAMMLMIGASTGIISRLADVPLPESSLRTADRKSVV